MPAKGSGVTSLSKLRARCSIQDRTDPDCCWLWKGASHGDRAGIWVVVDGKGKVLDAPRAAAVLSGKEIPPGGRAWAKCKNRMCCNPQHAVTGTFAEWGGWIREAQLWVGNVKNIAAAKSRGRKNSKINLSIAREIRESPLPPMLEAPRISEKLGVPISRTLVSNVRTGKRWAEPNPFDGLGAR